MVLVLIVIGAVAGWKSGALYPSAYAILAFAAIVVAALLLLLEAGGSVALLADPLTLLSGWLVAFLCLAVPYSLLAWLKAKRVENQGE